MNKTVGIIMGSASDLPVMEGAQKVLNELGVACEMTVVSAHRTPERMVEYARGAADRGLGVIIAGAGGAALANGGQDGWLCVCARGGAVACSG